MTPPRRKYKIIGGRRSREELEAKLNEVGLYGYRMVGSVISDGGVITVFMEREHGLAKREGDENDG